MKASKIALIVVDLQNDFMPGGALAVQNGDEVVPVANKLLPLFELVVASKDWHPAHHGVFTSQHPDQKAGERVRLGGIDQILWADHCVQNTQGSEFIKTLHVDQIDKIIQKGTDPELHSYSTFFDDAHKRATGLHSFLSEDGVGEVYILGLATDYCVKFSVLDAIDLGYKVFVVVDGCRGINLSPEDSEKAFAEMQKAGAHLVNSDEVVARLS
jgi:nicotinamidase/pyrazinamidase